MELLPPLAKRSRKRAMMLHTRGIYPSQMPLAPALRRSEPSAEVAPGERHRCLGDARHMAPRQREALGDYKGRSQKGGLIGRT